MAYADYPYYSETYGGTMPQDEFERLTGRASALLDRMTFDRIEGQPAEVMQRVKDACCAVADTCLLFERGGGIASETNDGIGITYVVGLGNAKSENEKILEAAGLYLANTGLLYRGVE